MGSTQRSSDPDEMSRVQEVGSTIRETVVEPVYNVLEPVLEPLAGSVLLKLAAMGMLLFALGALRSVGVWAAILAVWGFGLMLVGFGCYGLIWLQRN
ncbi:hypothetical protein HALLA_04460 (plasmid) [Halostagnicola larsenii XH-48]|uniref:Uncharacterized protein n=1 Tax=Halostagnicola larsenii XH-48 TaxID=797299 RepID=W0JX89_9EURY|nr:hypothetical protein [Halostagnicola larsenii]AHG01658.1 hypothetical protein HALLA_04460 [Halostagnicola larsenii XH-48]